MLLRSFGLCATFALAANSILIPSSFDIDDAEQIQRAQPALTTDSVVVRLDCPGCPHGAAFPSRPAGTARVQDVQTVLLLNLTICHEDGDLFYINDVQLYPPLFGQPPRPMITYQERTDLGQVGTSAYSSKKSILVTSYIYKFDSAQTIAENGMELLPMKFRIYSLDWMRVSPPEVTIYLLKDAEGHLTLNRVTGSPNLLSAHNPTIEDVKECEKWPLLCKWRAIATTKLQDLKMSFGKYCHKGRPHHRPSHGGRPHHTHGEGRPHHGHSRHHHLRRVVRILILTIVIPVLFGMIAGAFIYAVGMLMGGVAALILARLDRRRRDGYIALEGDLEGVSAKEVCSKGELLNDEVLLEAPPVYEEVAEKEVVS